MDTISHLDSWLMLSHLHAREDPTRLVVTVSSAQPDPTVQMMGQVSTTPSSDAPTTSSAQQVLSQLEVPAQAIWTAELIM